MLYLFGYLPTSDSLDAPLRGTPWSTQLAEKHILDEVRRSVFQSSPGLRAARPRGAAAAAAEAAAAAAAGYGDDRIFLYLVREQPGSPDPIPAHLPDPEELTSDELEEMANFFNGMDLPHGERWFEVLEEFSEGYGFRTLRELVGYFFNKVWHCKYVALWHLEIILDGIVEVMERCFTLFLGIPSEVLLDLPLSDLIGYVPTFMEAINNLPDDPNEEPGSSAENPIVLD